MRVGRTLEGGIVVVPKGIPSYFVHILSSHLYVADPLIYLLNFHIHTAYFEFATGGQSGGADHLRGTNLPYNVSGTDLQGRVGGDVVDDVENFVVTLLLMAYLLPVAMEQYLLIVPPRVVLYASSHYPPTTPATSILRSRR